MIREITLAEAVEVLKSGKDIFLFDDTDLTVIPILRYVNGFKKGYLPCEKNLLFGESMDMPWLN